MSQEPVQLQQDFQASRPLGALLKATDYGVAKNHILTGLWLLPYLIGAKGRNIQVIVAVMIIIPGCKDHLKPQTMGKHIIG